MLKYILKRIALMIPTLFGVLFITFAVIQFVPGGPIEQITSQLNDLNVSGEASSGGSSIFIIRVFLS